MFEEINDIMPKFNPIIAKGVAVSEMDKVVHELDRVLTSVSRRFPPGFVYEGSKPCDPFKEFEEATRPKYGKPTYEMARSDIFMVEYRFSWQGEMLRPFYMYLPYCGQAATLHLRGPMYTISPVMSDTCISVSENSIFIPFLCDRITFSRMSYTVARSDGAKVIAEIPWSPIHSYAARNSRKAGAKSTLGHYLFCKYGVTETFRKFANTLVVVGGDEINNGTYPEDDWLLFSSLGVAPLKTNSSSGTRWSNVYAPNRTKIAIPRKDYSPMVESLIGSFFYVADHFPDRIVPEYVDSVELWKVMLGHVIFRKEDNEGKLLNDVDAHLDSLDHYVDEIIKESMVASQIYSQDIYELFGYIIENIVDYVVYTDISNMYDKRLRVLDYVLLDYTKSFFHMSYKLTGNTKKDLDLRSILKILGKYLNRNLVFGLTKGHGEVNVVSCPGDSTLFKFTSKVVPQSDATGRARRSQKPNLGDRSKFAHVSIAELCSFIYLSKADPSGRTSLNAYAPLKPDLTFGRHEHLRGMLDKTQELIRRKD